MATWVGVRQDGEVGVITIVGRLTLFDGVAVLREKVRDLVERGLPNVLVNLAEAPYIDSAGVGELLAAKKSLERRGGRLKLLKPDRAVRDVLRVSRIDRVLESFDDEAAALRSFDQPRRPMP